MSKPEFDPNQPFMAGSKPEFDPSKPFDAVDSPPMPVGPDMSPIHPEGANPATMALSAAGQTFGVRPLQSETPAGQALESIGNQAMAPARLSNTLGAASAPAANATEDFAQKAGFNPLMTKASGLVAGAAVDPRSYVMPGGETSIAPENLPGAKVGEMLSGTPASNLNRAYKGGFYDTYVAPQGLKKSGQEFGEALSNAVTKHLTPEEQTAMLINPKGEANQKIADVYTQWLKGTPIETKDAVGAKVAISTVFPNNTAKNASKIAKLTEFEHALDGVISKDPSPEAQAFSKANSNYAASALRSNLLKPVPVNKSNPNEYSKLARYFMGGIEAGGLATGHGVGAGLGATAALVGSSPLAMGTLAASAGSLARGVNSAVNNPAVQALISKYLENQMNQKGRQ